MKKIILWVAFWVVATTATLANDAVISNIKANAPKQVTCQFEQQKFLKGMNKPVISTGTLYYKDQNFGMYYSQPEGDYIYIKPDVISMKNRGKVRNHNIKEGNQLSNLKNTLLMCISGDVNGVAKENEATLTYAKQTAGHEFTLTKELKKGEKGYSKIVLIYDAKTFNLISMTMVEANGNYSIYNISGHDSQKNVDFSIFK